MEFSGGLQFGRGEYGVRVPPTFPSGGGSNNTPCPKCPGQGCTNWHYMGWARVLDPLLVSACLRMVCQIRSDNHRFCLYLLFEGGNYNFLSIWVFVEGHNCFHFNELEVGGGRAVLTSLLRKRGGQGKIWVNTIFWGGG